MSAGAVVGTGGWRRIGFPLAVFAFVRLLLLAFGFLGTLVGAPLASPADVGGARDLAARLPSLAVMPHPDLPAYALSARDGLPPGQKERLSPLLVALVRVSHALGRSPVADLLWLSLLMAALAFVLVFQAAYVRAGAEAARATILFWAASPLTASLWDGGPLALGLALFGAAWWLAEIDRVEWSVLLAALAVFTHPALVAIVPLLVAAGLRRAGRGRVIALVVAAVPALVCVIRLGSIPDLSALVRGGNVLPAGPHLAALALGFAIIALGLLLSLVTARVDIAAATGLAVAVLLVADGRTGARGLIVCVPAYLPLGVLLSRAPLAGAGAYAVLGLFQGLFAYFLTHGFRLA